MGFLKSHSKPEPITEEQMLKRVREALSQHDISSDGKSSHSKDPNLSTDEGPCFRLTDDDLVTNFAKRYSEKGGTMYYCTSESEINDRLRAIQNAHGSPVLGCCNDNIVKFLNALGIEGARSAEAETEYKMGVLLCEGLEAWNGGIVLSDNLGFGTKFPTFPMVSVVIAFTSQVVQDWETLYDKMESARKQTSIATTIITPELKCFSSGAYKLYLILIEDQ